jgi:hypothetical protein
MSPITSRPAGAASETPLEQLSLVSVSRVVHRAVGHDQIDASRRELDCLQWVNDRLDGRHSCALGAGSEQVDGSSFDVDASTRDPTRYSDLILETAVGLARHRAARPATLAVSVLRADP